MRKPQPHRWIKLLFTSHSNSRDIRRSRIIFSKITIPLISFPQLKPLKLHEIPGETAPEPLKEYTEEELEGYKLADLQYQISIQEEKLNASKPNLSVIEEFLKKQEAYLQRVAILEEITAKRNEMRQLYDDVRKKRFTEFMQGFHIITKKLKEMYQMITLGGDAELELVDSMDPFNEGIVFSVRPPKKSWKMISNLSGGEKTLSSLALVFALHYYKPSPLYVMDEIDAALDFKNVSIVAHYIKVSLGFLKWVLKNLIVQFHNSRNARKTPSSSSSRCGRTCSSCPTTWSASTR